ncbi:S24 family peptidase [Paenirhodobacter populi]|nr:helix-turn-helix transcriptional regulator [Sinirhodobacter populi]
MDPILETIDAALKRKGLTDAAASKLAVGHSSLIKNLRMPRDGEKRYNLPALMKLAEVLDLEFYYGPRRETGPIENVSIDNEDYAQIPLHDAMLAAGNGLHNETEQVIEQLAFRKDWLKKMGLAASAARLARVQGDSMQPTLWHGDIILIDTASPPPQIRPKDAKDLRRPPIYALLDDGEARVKRVERPSNDLTLLISDNPDFSPDPRQGRAQEKLHVIGKVVWWGHAVKD